jgi:LysM repeat protein
MNILIKRTFLLIVILSFAAHLSGQRISRQQYIDKFKNLAISNMTNYGIPASITLAQACLESGDGNSRLAKEGNNHFGIKCHNWTGETITHDDDARNECFRKYREAEESFRDHSQFLRYRERYKFLFDLDPKDYKGWAYGLSKAGYATNPMYPQLLIKIIEDYGLDAFDNITAEIPPPPSVIEKAEIYTPPAGTELYGISLERSLYTRNGVAYIIATSDESYTSLAKEHKLFRSEILRFNDLDKEIPISDGTIVYLEKKKKRAEEMVEIHVTEQGDNMYSISQKYAVRLKYLYNLNKMKPGTEPAPGEIIKLR